MRTVSARHYLPDVRNVYGATTTSAVGRRQVISTIVRRTKTTLTCTRCATLSVFEGAVCGHYRDNPPVTTAAEAFADALRITLRNRRTSPKSLTISPHAYIGNDSEAKRLRSTDYIYLRVKYNAAANNEQRTYTGQAQTMVKIYDGVEKRTKL